MLNGSFFLSSDRQNIIDTDVMTNEDEIGNWNRYILMEILPTLHVKLLGKIASDNFYMQLNQPEEFKENITKLTVRDWPIASDEEFPTSGTYKKYGILVLQRLYMHNYRIFWTEANGGKLISFKESCFVNPDPDNSASVISDILTKQNVWVVKLLKEQFENIQELPKLKKGAVSPRIITPEFLCDTLRGKGDAWNSFNCAAEKNDNVHENTYCLLKFICNGLKSYSILNGVTLVPLLGGNIGTFGSQNYYFAKKEHRLLFKKSGPTHFIDELPDDLKVIFKNPNFFRELKVKYLNSGGILELLNFEFSEGKEYKWEPFSNSFPNKHWIDTILSNFTEEANIEFSIINKFPLLPMTIPEQKLVQFDPDNPLLSHENHSVVPVLVKLGIQFTDYKLPDNAHRCLKQCIIQFNDLNVMKSIEGAKNNASVSYEELFSCLSQQDISCLRTYVNDHLESFLGTYYFLLFILKSLFANHIICCSIRNERRTKRDRVDPSRVTDMGYTYFR